jgi:hypothetical protein
MFWTTAYGLVNSGRITGGGPRDPDERRALLASGWQPYSVVLGSGSKKEYYSIARVEPYGWLLGLAGDYAEIAGRAEDKDLDNVSMMLVTGLARSLSNKTYLQGLADFASILTGDEAKVSNFLKSRASSYVPNISSTFESDEFVRDARGIFEAMKAKLPWGSNDIPPRRNLIGESIEVPYGWLPFTGPSQDWARTLSPMAYSKQVDDAAKNELARLRYGFALPDKTISINGIRTDLRQFIDANGQDAWDFMLQRQSEIKLNGRTLGDSLNRLVKSDRYRKTENDQDRIDDIRELIQNYRERAKAEMLKKYPAVKQAIKDSKAANRPGARTMDALQLLN